MIKYSAQNCQLIQIKYYLILVNWISINPRTNLAFILMPIGFLYYIPIYQNHDVFLNENI